MEALQIKNAEWAARLQGKSVNASEFRFIGPDGHGLQLSDREAEMLEAGGVIVRHGKRIKLALGKTVEDVCEALNA